MSKFIYRLVPVHYSDVDGMESWLEDMAAKGYVLGQEGIFSGLVAFEKTEPKHYRYRLIANPFKYGWTGGRYNRYAPEPDEKTQEFHREFGWEYIATRKDFNIYRTSDPNAPEMDTDPQIQATAIHAAAKRKLWDIFWISLILLVYLFGTVWFYHGYLIGEESRYTVGYLVLSPIWLLFLLHYIYGYFRLKGLEKLLLSGCPLSHRSDYRRGRGLYWLARLFTPVCILLTFVMLYQVDLWVLDTDSITDLNDYSGAIPFATLEDIFPQADFREDIAWENSIITRSSSLAEVYKLDQQLHITFPDGTETGGDLEVDYRALDSAKAARKIADRQFREGKRKGNEPEVVSIEGADYAFVYRNAVYDYVFLCKDNVYAAVKLHIFVGDPITPEQLAQIIADSIR